MKATHAAAVMGAALMVALPGFEAQAGCSHDAYDDKTEHCRIFALDPDFDDDAATSGASGTTLRDRADTIVRGSYASDDGPNRAVRRASSGAEGPGQR